jgi:hypothetical protein
MTEETQRIEHDRYREWLTLEHEPGAALEPAARRALEAHLDTCGDCRTERTALGRMDALLSETRIGVRSGFREDLMRSLPAAGWEGKSPRSWRLPVAVMLLLGAAAALLLGIQSAETAPGLPLMGALAALGEAFSTGLLASTGMLWASWRGIGLALDTMLSPSATVALVALVLCFDVLALTLIARRGRAAAAPVAPFEEEGAGRGRSSTTRR